MDQLISGLLGGGGGGGANAGDNQPQQGGGGSGNQLANMAGELIGGFLGGGGGGSGALGGGAGGGFVFFVLLLLFISNYTLAADVGDFDKSAIDCYIDAHMVPPLLLNHGANVNETNAEGKDAVRIAQEQAEKAPDEDRKVEYEQMVQLLHEKK
ncbi:hypothetical protein niasHT_006591 [Heterodera trifolii]|uniref:Uncharacterized protein n=1 Tax=Heterodera trifolii TaxID=157864 RepID=A0ABD2M7N2_9BILA